MNKLSINIQSQFTHLQLDVTLNISLTGVTGIFGHSGSGKTSLLKTIAGLQKNATGSVTLNDLVLLNSEKRINLPPEQRHITGVFQQDGLFPHLTVLENLEYAIKRRKTAQISLTQLIDDVGLKPLLTQKIVKLSGGERQKVAISRALLAEPKLLLLDEPVTALDRINKKRVLRLVKRLQHLFSIPILYVSHNLEEIQALADNVMVMSDGKVINYGDVHQVIHQLNHSNLIAQQTSLDITQKNTENKFGLVELSLSPSTSIFTVNEHCFAQQNMPFRCYILARDISVSISKPDHSSIVNQVKGEISSIELNGNQVLLTVEHHSHQFYATISTYSLEKLALKVGHLVYLQFKASAVRQEIY